MKNITIHEKQRNRKQSVKELNESEFCICSCIHSVNFLLLSLMCVYVQKRLFLRQKYYYYDTLALLEKKKTKGDSSSDQKEEWESIANFLLLSFFFMWVNRWCWCLLLFGDKINLKSSLSLSLSHCVLLFCWIFRWWQCVDDSTSIHSKNHFGLFKWMFAFFSGGASFRVFSCRLLFSFLLFSLSFFWRLTWRCK